MRNILYLVFFFLGLSAHAQNIYPKKLSNCVTDRFCMDCGDIKGNVDKDEFKNLLDNLNATNTFKSLNGTVKFQVLIDSLSTGCVLSHTDTSNHPATVEIVDALNKFNGWIPAVTDGKTERKTSINMIFNIKNGILQGNVERVDMQAFEDSFETNSSPVIENTSYNYKNKHIKDYTFTIWNKQNSYLTDNSNYHIAIDGKNRLWTTSDKGIFYLDDKSFIALSQPKINNPKIKTPHFHSLAIDNNGTVWVYANDGIHSYQSSEWKYYSPETVFGVDGGYHINADKRGEVFFCSDQGLTILKDGKWSNINKNNLKELPSNRVCFAKRDSRGRLWIGTYSGSIMIDEKNMVTRFNDGNTPLKEHAILAMDEDSEGNFYFSLFDYNWETKDELNGIAISHKNGKWEHLNVNNSGLPYNQTNGIVYDRREKVLWLSTEKAGLIRYDLKGNWENYHSKNSNLPTSSLRDIALDNDGNIYIGTSNGVVQLKRN